MLEIFLNHMKKWPSLIETPEVIEVPEVENVAPEMSKHLQERKYSRKDNVEVVEDVANNEVPDDDVVSTENVMRFQRLRNHRNSQTQKCQKLLLKKFLRKLRQKLHTDTPQEIVQENSPEISAKRNNSLEIKINEEIVSKSFLMKKEILILIFTIKTSKGSLNL